MEQDRRRTVRFPFDASADVIEDSSGKRIVAHVSEVSLTGCFLQTADPFPAGASVVVKVFKEGRFFEAHGTVASSQAKLGMGVAFLEVKPYFLTVLRKWLLAAIAGKSKPKPRD
jgi:hypothetical protein